MPLFDPPRHDSAETIRRALNLGVNVKMITGILPTEYYQNDHTCYLFSSMFLSDYTFDIILCSHRSIEHILIEVHCCLVVGWWLHYTDNNILCLSWSQHFDLFSNVQVISWQSERKQDAV
jgi:hypothetical protein